MTITKEIIGDCELYHADCMDILTTMPKVDAVVTDPPYGINAYGNGSMGAGVLAKQSTCEPTQWDKSAVNQTLMDLVISKANSCIIFGGNYYTMPPSSCWLVWDKVNGDNNFADCELAWTNLKKAVRKITFQWHGMIRACGESRGDHPTQKPIRVMEWCISHLPDGSNIILDPFMGSGTTGVACVNLGRKFIGIEKDRKYFEIACDRIDRATKQGRLL